jgi:hypothetical protein
VRHRDLIERMAADPMQQVMQCQELIENILSFTNGRTCWNVAQASIWTERLFSLPNHFSPLPIGHHSARLET